MSKTKIEEIISLLKTKASAKQQTYEATRRVMQEIKKVLKGYADNLSEQMKHSEPPLRIEFKEYGEFEAHFSFGSDTLIFMMHTNVFDFDANHPIHRTNYIKEDQLREYCGVIQVYNFLAESIRYNREADMGHLVARIYVNKENHFFLEGNRPFNFMYADFASLEMNEMHVNNILEEAVLYCLNLDFTAPPVEAVRTITVEQKNYSSYNSGFRLVVAPGFKPMGLKEIG